MTPAQEYARWIQEARQARNGLEADAIQRLERLLARAASDVRQAIRETPRGILGERYRRQLLLNLEKALATFRAEYRQLLDQSILASAQIVEEREKQLLEALLATREAGGIPVTSRDMLAQMDAAARSFGQVPRRVLEKAFARIYPDGLRLSDRLWRMDLEARRQIADEVVSALATGRSARELAKRIEPLLTPAEGAGSGQSLRYHAQRIAVTEINTAYREGYMASVVDASGQLQPYISAVGWRLSASHPQIDICDWFAADDTDNLGPGNYLPEHVPASHPRCRCYLVSILAAYPDEQYQTHAPHPDAVPESQLRYYGVEAAA